MSDFRKKKDLLVPIVFGGISMSFRVQNKVGYHFSESHQQHGNSAVRFVFQKFSAALICS